MKRYCTLEKGIAGIEVSTFIAPEGATSIDQSQSQHDYSQLSRSGSDQDDYDDDEEEEEGSQEGDENEDFEAKINNVLSK